MLAMFYLFAFLQSHKWSKIVLDPSYVQLCEQLTNRSLPSWTLLAVLWQICHVWITNWIISGSVELTDRLSFTRRKFAILHAPVCFVADLPCLEHLQDVYSGYPDETRLCYTWHYAAQVTELHKMDGHMQLTNMRPK